MQLIKYAFLFFFTLAFHSGMRVDAQAPDWNKYIPGNQDENSSTYYGPTQINHKTMEDLTIFGPASIKNSTITQKTTVKGPVEAQHSSFNEFHIDGIASFDDVKLKKLVINGPVFARQSFLDEISIASNELTLSNTNVKKLLVRKNDHQSQKQRVYLEKGSQIDSIVFEAKNGRVIVEDASVVVNHLEGGEKEAKQDQNSQTNN